MLTDKANIEIEAPASGTLAGVTAQPDDVIPVLRKHGFWNPFEVKGISEVVGLSKPDLDFYRWAVQAAGCRAAESVMVGDTIKYDMRPAHRVGMRTVWFNPDIGRSHRQPGDEFERLYFESLLRQQQSRREKVRRSVQPDAMAHSSRELRDALERLLTTR